MPFENSTEALEALIDSQGLPEVLRMLATICGDKAEHIRTNWQDEKLAATWDVRMNCLNHVADKL